YTTLFRSDRSSGHLAQFAQVFPGIEPAIVAIAEMELEPAVPGQLQALDADVGIEQGDRAGAALVGAVRAGAGHAQRQATELHAEPVRPDDFQHFLDPPQANLAGRLSAGLSLRRTGGLVKRLGMHGWLLSLGVAL